MWSNRYSIDFVHVLFSVCQDRTAKELSIHPSGLANFTIDPSHHTIPKARCAELEQRCGDRVAKTCAKVTPEKHKKIQFTRHQDTHWWPFWIPNCGCFCLAAGAVSKVLPVPDLTLPKATISCQQEAAKNDICRTARRPMKFELNRVCFLWIFTIFPNIM